MDEERVIRNYQYWNGFNRFYCNGNVMLGPDGLKHISLTFLAINIPTFLIFIFVILVKYCNYRVYKK
jgi:hypothetical protein